MTRSLEKCGKRGKNGERLFFYSGKGKFDGKPHVLGGDTYVFQYSTWIQNTSDVPTLVKI